jgi:hemolysin activation/secretion protein
MYRSTRYKANLGLNLQIRDTENWIRDIRSEVGSRRASNVNLSWNNTLYHSHGTLIVRPSYQRGLDWFGSRKDPDDIMRAEPHLQYDMLKLYMYSSMRFNAGIPVTWNVTADSQYSFNNLYGVDRQSLGGEWTVRGFRNSAISGDRGFYVRNDFRLPIWNLTPNIVTNRELMGRGGGWSANGMLNRTQLAFFGDYGYVRNAYKILPDPYNSNEGQMAGAGIGLHYGGRHVNWSLTYARTLMSPEYLQTRDAVDKEKHSIYWRISATY